MFTAEAAHRLAAETIVREEFDAVPRLAMDGEVSQDFADDAAEFEAMPGTR